MPISRAVQASSALPGLYPPVEIDGHLFVDGVLHKTLHASVALEAGRRAARSASTRSCRWTSRATLERRNGETDDYDLERRGLPSVLSQTFRTLIHSRLAAGMRV